MTIKEKYYLNKFAKSNPVYGIHPVYSDPDPFFGRNSLSDSLFSAKANIESKSLSDAFKEQFPNEIEPKNLFIGKNGPQAIKYLLKGSPWVQQLNKDVAAQTNRIAKFQKLLDKDKALSWSDSPVEKFKVKSLIREKAPIVEAGDTIKELVKGKNAPTATDFMNYAKRENIRIAKDFLKNIGYGTAGLAAGGGLIYILNKLLSKNKKKDKSKQKDLNSSEK